MYYTSICFLLMSCIFLEYKTKFHQKQKQKTLSYNYPSFNFREHFCLLYKCKSCNFFAVPATVFIGLLLALPVTMIIIGKLTSFIDFIFSFRVYEYNRLISLRWYIHTQLILYSFSSCTISILVNFYSSISKNNIKHHPWLD